MALSMLNRRNISTGEIRSPKLVIKYQLSCVTVEVSYFIQTPFVQLSAIDRLVIAADKLVVP